MTSDKLPLIEPPFGGGDSDMAGSQSTVVGVVLAAGSSSRFGEANKLLAEWKDTPLVSHATDTLSQSAVDAVVVVVGDDAERVQAAISGTEHTVVHNDSYLAGQSTSVQHGLNAARNHGADAVVFALGDMPTVAVKTINVLIAAYRADVGDALAAACGGVRGNPVVFSCRHFEALADIRGDIGGREIFRTDNSAALVETGDPGVLIDVDHPSDLEEL